MEQGGRIRGLVVGLVLLALAGAALRWWLAGTGVANADEAYTAVALPQPAGEAPARERALVPAAREVALGERAPLEATSRAVTLLLTRFPDGAPLAHAPLAFEPAPGTAGWLAAGPDGRVELQLDPTSTTLSVLAEGYEPAQLVLDGRAEQELELRSLTGLFGFARNADGTPAASAEVEASFEQATLHSLPRATRERPRATRMTRRQVLGAATTAANGGYFLPCATATLQGSARVRAVAPGLAAETRVDLPRAADALEDLVLAPAPILAARVIDEAGQPIEGAWVASPENPTPQQRGALLTDARGIATWTAPALPATFHAGAEGMVLRRLMLDGVEVDASSAARSCETRVELVLAAAPSLKVRVVDAESGMPLFQVHGHVRLLQNGSSVASSSFEPDSRGEAQILMQPTGHPSPAEPDRALVRVTSRGYATKTLEIDLLALGPEPLTIALEPEPDTAFLRGRAVRAGEPVPGLQVAVKVLRRVDGAHPTSWHYERAWTDDEGRFSLRFKRDAPDQVVTVYPHWTRWDEFAYIGPLDVQDALAREHLLELQPAVLVPALLRGVSREGAYRYYVSVLDGDVAVSSTVNGAPIRCQRDGEARVLLALPAQRRVRVTIGAVQGNYVQPDCSTPAVHDPAAPDLPLVFDVEPLFARLQGHVVGFPAAELATLSVGYAGATGDQASLVPVQSGGRFEIPNALRGRATLYLARADGLRAELLARISLEVTGDRADLVLAADPESL